MILIGSSLITFGILMLLRNIGIITENIWLILWPLLIALFGLALVLGKQLFVRDYIMLDNESWKWRYKKCQKNFHKHCKHHHEHDDD